GNALGQTTVVFTTGDDASDVTPPQVALVSPRDGSSGVPVNVKVDVLFTESLNPLTVNAQSASLRDANGAVAAVLGLSDADRSLRIAPAANLSPSTLYASRLDGLR